MSTWPPTFPLPGNRLATDQDWNSIVSNLTGSQIKTGSLTIIGNVAVTGSITQSGVSLAPLIVGSGSITSGSLFLISDNETAISGSIPGNDTALRSGSILSNNYSYIVAEVEGFVLFNQGGSASASQYIGIKIKDGSVQKGPTQLVSLGGMPGVVGSVPDTIAIPFSIKRIFVETGSANISLTHSGSASDSFTFTTVTRFTLWGLN
jgi:hypothetical protein